MCLTKKESLSALLIMVIVSTLLFIRNNGYDRLISILFFVISLIQLTEYLLHDKLITPDTGGRLIFLILWLQVTVLAIGMEISFHTLFTTYWAIIYSIIFIVAIYYSFTKKFNVTSEYGHLVWTKENENGNILGSAAILYMIGLFAPFIILQYYNKWNNIPIWILLCALILSFVLIKLFYPKLVFSSLWCYSAIGVLFVAWLVGAFHEHNN